MVADFNLIGAFPCFLQHFRYNTAKIWTRVDWPAHRQWNLQIWSSLKKVPVLVWYVGKGEVEDRSAFACLPKNQKYFYPRHEEALVGARDKFVKPTNIVATKQNAHAHCREYFETRAGSNERRT